MIRGYNKTDACASSRRIFSPPADKCTIGLVCGIPSSSPKLPKLPKLLPELLARFLLEPPPFVSSLLLPLPVVPPLLPALPGDAPPAVGGRFFFSFNRSIKALLVQLRCKEEQSQKVSVLA